MWSCHGYVRITLAAKDLEVIVRRRCAKQGKVWCGEGASLGLQNVEQNLRGGEFLDPVGGRHGGLKQQGANDIVGRPNNALSFNILRRGVGAGYAKMDAQEGADASCQTRARCRSELPS